MLEIYGWICLWRNGRGVAMLQWKVVTSVGLRISTRRKTKIQLFWIEQPLWPFGCRSRSLRDALECTMKSLSLCCVWNSNRQTQRTDAAQCRWHWIVIKPLSIDLITWQLWYFKIQVLKTWHRFDVMRFSCSEHPHFVLPTGICIYYSDVALKLEWNCKFYKMYIFGLFECSLIWIGK